MQTERRRERESRKKTSKKLGKKILFLKKSLENIKMTILTFQGHQNFRQRFILSILTGKAIVIQKIRSADEENPGLSGKSFQ